MKPTIFKKTLFRKVFEKLKSPIARHFYCSSCLAYLEQNDSPCECENRQETSYFIEIQVASQIISLFSRERFYEDLQYRFFRQSIEGTHGEIYDGDLYRKLFKPGRFLWDKNNISFTWYSDGIPVFKSKTYSLWPMYLLINELPNQKRILQQNVIIAGLWFGPSEPVVNMFLKPLHQEMTSLASDGVAVKTSDDIVVKAVTLYGTGDTPARSDFLEHIRFNGDYGCTGCEVKGYTISGNGFGNTHIYPCEGEEK